jgi:co-chaperonin GroES (HSP10)
MIKGTPRAIGDRVLVTDMHFGEQKTSSGIIVGNDDGKARGIYPRWAKVFHKGPNNTDEYNVGDWILIEHGRWTRGVKIDLDGEEATVRMVDPANVLAFSDEKPEVGLNIGQEYSDGPVDINPESFMDSGRMF